ncbi:alpha/beta-hydrolase, partial [Neoconidiobolus thromboides FSU 785]
INLISVDEPYAKRMAYLAGTSYCNNSNIVSWNCTRCQQFPEARAFGIYLDEVTQGKAVLIIDERGKNIVLSFRGTSNIYNWFSNAQVLLTNLYFGNFKIKVHSGFKAMNEKLFKLYSNDLKELLKQYSDFNLIITGHSLGGAVSSLATIKIKEKLNIKDDRLINISYGSPRVGNHHFALKYNSMKHRVLRVTNKRDIVPHIPPRLLGYAHHQREFWVETPPKLNKFCDQSVYEDPNCSLSMEPELSVQDHFVYWDIHISGTC